MRDRLVTGLFRDRESAEKTYGHLGPRGYRAEDVDVMMSDETRRKYYEDTAAKTELGTKALEGVGVGAGIGAVADGALPPLPPPRRLRFPNRSGRWRDPSPRPSPGPGLVVWPPVSLEGWSVPAFPRTVPACTRVASKRAACFWGSGLAAMRTPTISSANGRLRVVRMCTDGGRPEPCVPCSRRWGVSDSWSASQLRRRLRRPRNQRTGLELSLVP
jgi:hypothetical protein